MDSLNAPSRKVKLIAVVNGLAAILHVVFWGLVFLRLPPISTAMEDLNQADLIVTYGLGIADLIWSVPLLIIGSIWLQKHRLLGWLAAQMANVLWGYSFTFIFFRECNTHIRPGTILFLPFALFSLWSAYSLWKVRSVFLEKET